MQQYASVAICIQRIHNKGVLQHLLHYYTKGHELQMLTLQRDPRRMKKSCKNRTMNIRVHESVLFGLRMGDYLSVISFDVMNRKFKQ